MVAIAIITRFGLGRIANGRVAQLAEHTPEKRGVTGSTPVSTTIYDGLRGRRFCLLRLAQSNKRLLRHRCHVSPVFVEDIPKSKSPAIDVRMTVHVIQVPRTRIDISVKPHRVIEAC